MSIHEEEFVVKLDENNRGQNIEEDAEYRICKSKNEVKSFRYRHEFTYKSSHEFFIELFLNILNVYFILSTFLLDDDHHHRISLYKRMQTLYTLQFYPLDYLPVLFVILISTVKKKEREAKRLGKPVNSVILAMILIKVCILERHKMLLSNHFLPSNWTLFDFLSLNSFSIICRSFFSLLYLTQK